MSSNNSNDIDKLKYLKYKNKYNKLKKTIRGGNPNQPGGPNDVENVTIHIGSFIKGRQFENKLGHGVQPKDSSKTLYTGSDDELLNIIKKEWSNRQIAKLAKDSQNEKHILEIVIKGKDVSNFVINSQSPLNENEEFIGKFIRRNQSEPPRKNYIRQWTPTKPNYVTCILYSATTLNKDYEEGRGSKPELEPKYDNDMNDLHWELITCRGSLLDQYIPIHYETLMYNHFGYPGGTPYNWTPIEFENKMKESFEYWHNRV